MALNSRLDQKIQLYRKKVQEIEGTTKEAAYREFPYSEDKFLSGGIWTNARAMSVKEAVESGLTYDEFNVVFTVPRSKYLEITTDLKVIYRGEIYDIKSIDDLDFRARELKFTAVRTADKTSYAGDLFTE